MNIEKIKEYRCAYKEVLTILDVIDIRLKRLIPKDKINFYKRNADESYFFKFDYSKKISEQDLLYSTRCIIANLFRNYIAVEKDKNRIIENEKREIKRLKEQKIYKILKV